MPDVADYASRSRFQWTFATAPDRSFFSSSFRFYSQFKPVVAEVLVTTEAMVATEVVAIAEVSVVHAMEAAMATDTEAAAATATLQEATAAVILIMVGEAAAVEVTTFHQRHRPTNASPRANGATGCLDRSGVSACLQPRPSNQQQPQRQLQVHLRQPQLQAHTNDNQRDKYNYLYDNHDQQPRRLHDGHDDAHIDYVYDNDHIHCPYHFHNKHRDVDYDYAYDNHDTKHNHHALYAYCIDNNPRDIYNYDYVNRDANQ
ncbi:hypothetical protein AAVH_14402 [Aphelenchoides avenae]|nr:hypothetical protein AAVH_14402 [Aphelenchus avenae]